MSHVFRRIIVPALLLVLAGPARDAAAVCGYLYFGSANEFNSATTSAISTASPDSTHIVHSYRDDGTASYGTAVVGTVSGRNITYGTPVVFNSDVTSVTAVTSLDSTHVLIAYSNGLSKPGTAVVGTISGNSISYGTPVVFESASTDKISVTALDSTHALIAYRDAGGNNYGNAVVATISGISISYGTPVAFHSNNVNFTGCVALDSTHAVIAYAGFYDSNDSGLAIVATISGDVITYGSPAAFYTNDVTAVITGLDSSHVLIAYADLFDSSYGKAVIGTITGNSIAYGTTEAFASVGTSYVSAAALDSSQVLIGYKDTSDSGKGKAVVATVSSGDVLSYGTPVVFDEVGDVETIAAAALDSSSAVFAYRPTSNYGAAVVQTCLEDPTNTTLYCYDSYAAGWETDPGNMADCDTATYAETQTDNQLQELTDHSVVSGFEDYGTILKVEAHYMAAYASGQGSDNRAEVTPVFGGTTSGDNHDPGAGVLSTSAAWLDWIDVTYDTNAPSSWSWSDVTNLDLDVNGVVLGGRLKVYKFELRVTWEGAGFLDPDEFRVNTTATATQWQPSVAMDADGDFVVVWNSQFQDGSGFGVYGQRYNSSVVHQGGEFQVNTETDSHQSNPVAAMDDNGNFVVAWESYGQDNSFYGIYAQRYDADGNALDSEFQVSTTTSNDQEAPSIAMDADGDFVVVWTGDGTGDAAGIFGQRYNSSGVAQDGEFRINSEVNGTQQKPAVAMDDSGNFVVVWESDGQDGSGLGVYGQRYNASGVAQDSEFPVNTTTADAQSNPTVGMDGDGDFVIAWSSSGQDGDDNGVYARRYNAAGVAQSGEVLVNTETANSQTTPAMAMDGSGNYVIVWQSYGQEQSESAYGLYGQKYSAGGSTSGGEFHVNTTTDGGQSETAIAMGDSGAFAVAWRHWPSAGGSNVYARYYAASSAPNAPSALGPSHRADGSARIDKQPTLQFTQSDSQSEDSLSFRLQIDDDSDFSSPVVDYTSESLAQGATTFTVGQAAGSGSYTTGSASQQLPRSGYYWRVLSNDGTEDGPWATANGGAVAFYVGLPAVGSCP